MTGSGRHGRREAGQAAGPGSAAREGWVGVAVVLGPHALDGVLRLKPLTRTLDEFMDAPIDRLTALRNGQPFATLTLQRRAVHKGLVLASFEEVADRTTAEDMQGCELAIPASERWDLPEQTWYADDLLGLEVLEDGRSIGRVRAIRDGAAHDYLVFGHEGYGGREVLLPMVSEFVLRIDTTGGRIEVRLPAGLVD